MFKRLKIFKRMTRAEEEIEDINSRIKPLEYIAIYTEEEFREKFPTLGDFYSSHECKELRKRVFMRDKHTCQKCGNVGIINHHINSVKYYPEMALDIGNCLCLCDDCHEEINRQNRERMRRNGNR